MFEQARPEASTAGHPARSVARVSCELGRVKGRRVERERSSGEAPVEREAQLRVLDERGAERLDCDEHLDEIRASVRDQPPGRPSRGVCHHDRRADPIQKLGQPGLLERVRGGEVLDHRAGRGDELVDHRIVELSRAPAIAYAGARSDAESSLPPRT